MWVYGGIKEGEIDDDSSIVEPSILGRAKRLFIGIDTSIPQCLLKESHNRNLKLLPWLYTPPLCSTLGSIAGLFLLLFQETNQER